MVKNEMLLIQTDILDEDGIRIQAISSKQETVTFAGVECFRCIGKMSTIKVDDKYTGFEAYKNEVYIPVNRVEAMWMRDMEGFNVVKPPFSE